MFERFPTSFPEKPLPEEGKRDETPKKEIEKSEEPFEPKKQQPPVETEQEKQGKKVEPHEEKKEISSEIAESQEQIEQERQELIKEVTRGLENLYDLLPHGEDIEEIPEEFIKERINETELHELSPVMQGGLSKWINKRELYKKDKGEFVVGGFEYPLMTVWIYFHAMGRSLTKEIEKLNARLEQEKKPPGFKAIESPLEKRMDNQKTA